MKSKIKIILEKYNCVVFNVDYSLAPEKPFPNGLNDNYIQPLNRKSLWNKLKIISDEPNNPELFKEYVKLIE